MSKVVSNSTVLSEKMGRLEFINLHVSNRTLQKLFRMVLIKSVAFVIFEILRNLVSMQNFLMQITADVSKTLKTFHRDLTFIFDVLSEPLLGFVSYMFF